MKQHFCAITLTSSVWLASQLVQPFSVAAQAQPAGHLIEAPSTAEDKGSVWGGGHIEITMNANGGDIEFDCASGTISAPFKVDAQGKFQADGTFTREHGGPVRLNEDNATAPAKYSGSIAGDTMHLDVVLVQSRENVGSYVLKRGQAGRVFKCR
jgi:hypothetical protein